MGRKSQLAIEYSYQVRSESPAIWVFWVQASNEARFEQSFRDIADQVKIPGRQDPKAYIFKLVENWLRDEKNGKWVCIIDNANDDEFLFSLPAIGKGGPAIESTNISTISPLEFIPRSRNGSVLVTSRSKEVALRMVDHNGLIEVKPMDSSEALELFQRKLEQQGEDQESQQLMEELEFMPLAIVQAASYIMARAPRYSVSQYLRDFRGGDRNATRLLQIEAGHLYQDWEAKNSILVTWQISFDHINQRKPSAADMLFLMSFYDRQGIPEKLIRLQPDANYKSNSELIDDSRGRNTYESDMSPDLEDDINILRDYSFISISEDKASFTMHRLVQLIARAWLKSHGQINQWRERSIRNLYQEFPTGQFENWEKCRWLFPHVRSLISQRPKSQESLLRWATILYNGAWYALESGNITDAKDMASKSRQQRIKLLDAENEETLASTAMLARVYLLEGQWVEAEQLFMQVMETRKMKLGADHPSTLMSMTNLASTFWKQGRWEEAEQLQMQVLQTSRTKLGADHPETLTSMANLAETYMKQGRWEEAKQLQMDVLQTSRTNLGVVYPDTLTSMENPNTLKERESHTHNITFGYKNAGFQIGMNNGPIRMSIMGADLSHLNPGLQNLGLSSQPVADVLPQKFNLSGEFSGTSELSHSLLVQKIHEECGMEIFVPAANTRSEDRSTENQPSDQCVPQEMDDTLDEEPWVKALFPIGYSDQDVLNLVSEKEKDCPWIFFEPSDVLVSDIKIGQHVHRCSHHCCIANHLRSSHTSGTVTSFASLGTMNHEDLIEKVEELCGLAGIRPSTREMHDWVGSSDFRDDNTVASCRLFKNHLSPVLSRICSAASLLQQNGLCCDSFTILKICSPKQTTEIPFIEVVPVKFQLITTLNQALTKFDGNPENEEMVSAASKDILQLVLPNATEFATLNDNGQCFRLCALAVQFLSLGLLSYTQAHVGPIRPFFLDTSLKEIILLGLAEETVFPCLVSKLVNLTCFGNMTRGAVLAFHCHPSPSNDLSPSDTYRQSNSNHDLQGHAEDILDTWGPGNLVFHDRRAGSPVAIKIGDGFISKHEADAKFHWDYELKEPAHAIQLSQSLLIGTLVVPNTECQLSEADCRTSSVGALEYLGASRSSWKKSQRQITLQGGQYAMGQVTETWNKQRGIPIKDVALSNFQNGFIGYLNEHWGLQVSYCTGVARRVPLRKLVADLIPQFLKITTIRCDLENLLKDDHMSLIAFQSWLEGLETQSRTQILETIERILHSLRHTGLDATEKYFCIGWPWDGDTSRCFQVPLEGQSSWVRMLADSHDCATFAYITMQCFEAMNIKCRRLDPGPVHPNHITLLETAVVCPTQTSQAWSLQNGEVYFFSKLDSIFWVKVEREHAARTSSLVELAAIMSIPHDMKRRLYVSERKKQRSRLRERSTPLIQGEVVSVFSMRKSS